MVTKELLELEIEAIIKSSKSNIVIADGTGRVLRASPNCFSIYGREAEALIGKNVIELEEEGVFSPSVTVRVLEEKKEMYTMQKTKTGRVAMAAGVPIYDKQGEIIRVISFSHDLTEIEQLKTQYENLKDQMQRYQSEIEGLRDKHTRVEGIIIQSKVMQNVWDLIHRVAKSDATILFSGESGVGKSIYAKIIHKSSDRKSNPFVEVNCGSIPESLFESEMFGYEAGSFTGANKKGKAGIIEVADKGTLFLDEIGELPLAMQAKLLKVIQQKKTTRIGGVKQRTVDFRLIAATNQNLDKMVKEGQFRKDLYFRLNVIPIQIPPLRERVDDISMLAQYYLESMNEKYKMKKRLDSKTIDSFLRYDWPGNVRELENMVERLVLTVEEPTIKPEHLPFYVVEDVQSTVTESKPPVTLRENLEMVEKEWLKRAYQTCKTTYEMAEYLGISQPSVVRKLKKYQID